MRVKRRQPRRGSAGARERRGAWGARAYYTRAARPGPLRATAAAGPSALQGRPRPPRAQPRAQQAGPPGSPWPPRHAPGRPASRGGTRTWCRAAHAVTTLGSLPLPRRDEVNLAREKQHTKHSSNQILLLPLQLGLHSGLRFGGLPSVSETATEKLSSSCSREPSDLPAPARSSRVGTCSGAPALGGTQPPRPPGGISVASGQWHLMPAASGVAAGELRRSGADSRIAGLA